MLCPGGRQKESVTQIRGAPQRFVSHEVKRPVTASTSPPPPKASLWLSVRRLRVWCRGPGTSARATVEKGGTPLTFILFAILQKSLNWDRKYLDRTPSLVSPPSESHWSQMRLTWTAERNDQADYGMGVGGGWFVVRGCFSTSQSGQLRKFVFTQHFFSTEKHCQFLFLSSFLTLFSSPHYHPRIRHWNNRGAGFIFTARSFISPTLLATAYGFHFCLNPGKFGLMFLFLTWRDNQSRGITKCPSAITRHVSWRSSGNSLAGSLGPHIFQSGNLLSIPNANHRAHEERQRCHAPSHLFLIILIGHCGKGSVWRPSEICTQIFAQGLMQTERFSAHQVTSGSGQGFHESLQLAGDYIRYVISSLTATVFHLGKSRRCKSKALTVL